MDQFANLNQHHSGFVLFREWKRGVAESFWALRNRGKCDQVLFSPSVPSDTTTHGPRKESVSGPATALSPLLLLLLLHSLFLPNIHCPVPLAPLPPPPPLERTNERKICLSGRLEPTAVSTQDRTGHYQSPPRWTTTKR